MEKINSNTVFELDPTEIIIDKELSRHRKDMGDIKKMVASIEQFGQLQPVVISRDKRLICGGRRLAACLLGGFKVKVCYRDTIDPLLMKELELEENIQRKDLTPAEESIAIKELVELKRKIHGVAVQNKAGSGFTLEDAAEIVGKSKAYVIDAMNLADAIQAFPELAKAKSKKEIRSAYKGMERVSKQMEAVSTYEELTKSTKEFVITKKDARMHMKGLPDASIDLLLTDPPYGINIDKTAIGIGGHTGGETTAGFKYSDTPEEALELYSMLAIESYRFCKDTAHALVFCGPSHFWPIKNMFNHAGWNCSERPLIWYKRDTGQSNNPTIWPVAVYEMILFARRTNSTLALQGKGDVLQCPPVVPSQRLHQAEKPLELLKELISRTTLPGKYLYDPFMGSGASIEAALESKLFALGCDISDESYATALSRIVTWKENQSKKSQ